MAVTALADIVVPEVLADQVSAKYPDSLVLASTSVVETDPNFPLGSPGTTFTIPFWKRIGEFGALEEGTPIAPGKITTGKENALVQRGAIGLEIYDTAQLATAADPVGEIANQIARRAAEYLDSKCVAAMENTPNVHDITGEQTKTVTADALITAMVTKLGDKHQELLGQGRVIMHSKVYGDLLKLGVIQNNYQSGMDVLKNGFIGTILGLPIVISDRVTKVTVSGTTTYNTYIAGAGAIGLFFQRQVMVEFDRDVLGQSDIVVATVHFASHLYGWDDSTDTQAAEDAKSIPVILVKSN